MDGKEKFVSLSIEKLKCTKQELRKRVLIRNAVLACVVVKRKSQDDRSSLKRQRTC